MENDRIVLGEQNKARVRAAHDRFQQEISGIAMIVLDQHGLNPAEYSFSPDFATLIKKPETKG